MAENYAIMPLQDYEAACDAIRGKTGGTDPIRSEDMAAQIQGISVGDDLAITDASYLFFNGARLDNADELIARIKGCTNANHMFAYGFTYSASGTRPSSYPIAALDTSNVTDMSYMFENAQDVCGLDLSGFNTHNVTRMSGMFKKCFLYEKNPVELDLSSFDTQNVTSMDDMFYGCEGLIRVNMSSFSTGKLSSMQNMFGGCSYLVSINLSNFDTTRVSSFSALFNNCRALEEIIGLSATNKAGMSITLPYGTSSSHTALRRLTFRTDLPEGQYAIRSAINIRHCSFERGGMVEMFETLPDVSALGLTTAQTTITITGNPCVTDGTLTDADRSIATGKGWTLVE